jgi:hypothetical protein
VRQRDFNSGYCCYVDDDNLSLRLDKIDLAVTRLEDSILGLYDEILRLRVDVSKVESRFEERWGVIGVEWKRP